MGRPESTLRAAVRVREALDNRGAPCALIGALALAVHGYTRATKALTSAVEHPDLGLRVVDLPHLVALKLKAGGPGHIRDVMELLRIKHPPEVETVCARHKLGDELDRVLAEL
jgi:hypothetical protein